MEEIKMKKYYKATKETIKNISLILWSMKKEARKL